MMKTLLAALSMAGVVWAQVPNPTQRLSNSNDGSSPIFKVTVTSRSTRAVNYRHRSGSTKVDFRGTALMPQAHGEASVDSKQGVLKVDAKFKDMDPPTKFGPEYLTYVLWAISPEGRPENLGEILIGNGDDSKVSATVDLQAFGLIVTAEPYYAVTVPSDVVVMENEIRNDTMGKWEFVDAKYELLPRGQYTYDPRGIYRRIVYDKRYPLELFEARNAVEIAQLANADKYAANEYKKAADLLQQAENYASRKAGTKPTISVSREAVQTAEDARNIAIRRQQEEQQERERQAALDRENAAKAQAAESARQRRIAEEQRQLAETQARAEEQRRAQAEADRAAAERAKAEALAAAQDANRLKAEADQARQQADLARQQAEAARQAALQQQQALAGEAEKARLAAAEADRLRQQAENDKQALRKQLLDQFNMILETRDTARGLIVNLNDVLFDTGSYTLRPGAREKLARLAGIILSHPGLRLEVEGHTDSVGGDAYNQKLSENRAESVRTYMTAQGIGSDKITARGFGKTMPVASNNTAAGRQQNRRVEIVVSGEVIGTSITSLRTAPATTPAATVPPQR